jgi:hypothetical protein
MMMNGKNGLSAAHVITVPRFEPRHILYMALCLAGAAAALYLFWRDLNLTLERFQDEPVGVVTRKQNTVQRRFADRTLWDRLRGHSPVYPGDYIRTAEFSAADLSLSGGELISLGEHTLIQLLETAGGLTVDLAEGGLEAEAGPGGLTVRSAGVSLRAGEGSVFTGAVPETGGFEASVRAGSAVLVREGQSRTLRPGDTAGLSRPGPHAAVLSPRPEAVFLNGADGPAGVNFAWNRADFASGQALRLELAEDRAFTALVRSHDSLGQSLSVELENGLYFWRAYPAGQDSMEGGASGRLRVVDASPPKLISPAAGEEFNFASARPGLRFVWTSREGAEFYHIAISAGPDMADPLFQSRVEDSGGEVSSIVFSGFEEGTWYWRVRPEYPRNHEGTARASPAGSFRIRRTEGLNAPAPWFPAPRGSLYLEDKTGETCFSWKQEADAVSYTFLLSRREDLSDPLIKEKVRDNYFIYSLKNGGLAPGRYYWGVYQTGAEGGDSARTAARSVFFVAGPPPENPELSPPEAAAPMPETAAAVAETFLAPPQAAPLPEAAVPPEAAPAIAELPAAAETRPAAARPGPSLPPLPAPANMRPAPDYVLTEEIIIRDRQMSFSWNAVSGASSYVFILYQEENGGRRELLRRTQSETGFTITDLTVLDAGTFIWRVEPVSRTAGQAAEAGESGFSVSIAEIQASRGQESGVMFGNE